MQRILRATARAKTQARRKLAIVQAQNERIQQKLRRHEEGLIGQEIQSRIRAAREARKEDWLLGSLAPRRDVGDLKHTYGTVSVRQIRGIEKSEGQWKEWCIREGDRVVIVGKKQRDRGKIGTVKSVNQKAEECMVDGLNVVDVATPSYLIHVGGDDRPIQTTEASIPLSEVRLVYPLPHPETGALRDVVIKKLKYVREKKSKNKPERRYIAGLEPITHIPFPEQPKPEYQDYDIDTLRIQVEHNTWIPTLLEPPMPKTVIDELRNKYSVFRTRHDDAFVQKKEAQFARQQNMRRKRIEMMRTPMQEFNRDQRAERRKLGRQPVDEETMKRIGEIMARNGVKVKGDKEILESK